MTLANQLTVARLLLAPVVVTCVIYARFGWALAALALAGLTDAVDGAVARWRQEDSELGALLDPLADKVLVVSAVAILAAPLAGLTVRIPAWVAVAILARDAVILLVTGAYNLAVERREFRPTRLGKWATAVNVTGIFWILLANHLRLESAVTTIILGMMAALTVLTSIQYLVRVREL